MLILLFLGVALGAALHGAGNHFILDLRLRRLGLTTVLGATALAVAAYEALSLVRVRASDVPAMEAALRWQSATAFLVVAGVIWVYRFLLQPDSDRVPVLLTTAAAVLATTSFLFPAGLFYAEVTGVAEVVVGPPPAIHLPVAEYGWPNTLPQLLVWSTVAWIGAGLVRKHREGQSRTALLGGGALALLLMPVLAEFYLVSDGTLALPVIEGGMALFLLVLSLMVSDDFAAAARARERLAESEQRFRALVLNAPEAIVLYDAAAGRVELANEEAARLFALSPGEMAGGTLFDHAPEVQSDGRLSEDVASELVSAAAAGEQPSAEWVLRDRVGAQIPTRLHVTRIPYSGNRLLRVSLQDLRDEKLQELKRAELEQRLRRSERLETIGGLAGGIAHDFNNLLLPIVAYSEVLAEELPGEDEREMVRRIQSSADKARNLVRQILAFSRKEETQLGPIVLQDSVEQGLRLLGAAIPARVKLVRELEAPDGVVVADDTQMQQVVMNLGTNAVQAMPRGGTLRVSLRVAPAPDLYPGGDFGSDQALVLEVEDTGTGMDAETATRSFDPFFTTKEPGSGTGLGLSVVHGIVTSHGGMIDVESHPGEGTRFSVYLPTSRGDRAEAPQDHVATGGTERVLVVDDQEEVLVALSRVLRALGYEPVPAGTADEGLELVRAHDIEAALLDHDMPEMSGAALARALRDEQPDLPIIFISGSHHPDDPENLDGHRSLLKPVGRYELDSALRDVLGGGSLIVPDDS